jgi:acetyl esterase/lipase
MPLHPVAVQMLEEMAASGRPNAHLLPVPVARQNFEDAYRDLERPEVGRTTEESIPVEGTEIGARSYTPQDDGRSRPLMVFFHGGGWLMGSVESHDVMVRKIALATDCVVLSVGYRRGPESRFPTAVDDAFASVRWAAENAERLGGDPSRLLVGGDSAGANLATVVAARCRDEGGPEVVHQLLVYPVTTCDLDLGFDMTYEGVMLYRDEMLWHQENYLANADDRDDPRVSPLGGRLDGLPPATVVLAECDPIRPQGRLYADALAAAGVQVDVEEFPGMIHGFFGLDMMFPEAADAMDFAGRSVRKALDVSS